MSPAFIVWLYHHGSHILVVARPIVRLSSSNHFLVPVTGTAPLMVPDTIHWIKLNNYDAKVMLLSENFLVDIDGTIWVSDPFVLNVKVTHFPSCGCVCINLFLDNLFVQKPGNSDLIKTRHVSLLLNTLIVHVSDIRTSVEETGFNWAQNLLAFESIVQTFFLVCIVNFIRYEIMAF